MNSLNKYSVILAAGITGLTAQANAATYIHEPFAYDAGNFNGDPATGTGLTGNWSSNRTGATSGALTFGDLETTSGTNVGAFTTFTRGGGAANVSTGNSLDGNLGNGDILWFSVLVNLEEINSNRLQFGIGNVGVDGFGRYGGDQPGEVGMGFTILNGKLFTEIGNGVNGPNERVGNVQLVAGTSLIVGKYTFGATEDLIELYTPSSSDLSTPGGVIASDTSNNNIDQTLFDIFSFGGARLGANTQGDPYRSSYLIDEVRFGDTYEDVVLVENVAVVPEPSAAILGVIGSLLLLRRRR